MPNTIYVPITNLRLGEKYIFKKIITKASKNKHYLYKDDNFISNLDYNQDTDEPYLYSYDINSTLLDRGDFMQKLEALINVANREISLSKKYYNNYRFEIVGDNTKGKIIVMRKSTLTSKNIKSIDKKMSKEIRKDMTKFAKNKLEI